MSAFMESDTEGLTVHHYILWFKLDHLFMD